MIKGLTSTKEYSESDLAVLDIDNDGDNDIVAVAGGFEYQKESEKQENLYMAAAAGFGGRMKPNTNTICMKIRLIHLKRSFFPYLHFLLLL